MSTVLVNEDRADAAFSARQLKVLVQTNRMPLAARTPVAIPDRSIDHLAKTQELIPPERAATDIRLALEEAVLATEVAAALTRSVLDALASLAMAVAWSEPQASPHAPFLEAQLSPREREVLALVAKGQSNKTIAAALYVSPNTVKTHVSSLLTKLRADSRIQLATIATRHELPQLSATGAGGTPCAMAVSRPRR
jgi:DNA-binding CsgD family transcriptional regulator